MSVLYFLLMVGGLVVIHEFGHFLAAKLLDFRVLRFSVGFGRPLFRVKHRETEYQVALIPLGGYVRILGEDAADEIPPEMAGKSFNAQPLWRRVIVVFAGPAANLVLPIFIYFIVFAGESELPAAVVGDVVSESPAVRAGIEPGDRVLAIGGTSVRYWEELEDAVKEGVGQELKLKIRRGDREFEKYIRPVEYTARTRDGSSSRAGYIGITQAPFPPLVGVIDPRSPAGRVGLQTGDRVISVDGSAINNWTTLRRTLSRGLHARNVVYLRDTPVPGIPQVRLLDARTAQLVPDPVADDDGATQPYTGVEHAELFVIRVAPGSPADRAGLRPGDLIETLDGEPVHHWLVFDQRMQSRPDHDWTLTWRRYSADDGKVLQLSARVNQVSRKQFDEYGATVERLVFGAITSSDRGQGEMVPIRGRVSYAAAKAFERTGDTIATMVSGFWSILAGHASHESLGGPVMMYRAASVSGHKGWETFLLMMALISVNLGLINLLPVPVLDGGHLVVFAVEAVRRKPLSPRARERIQLAGLGVVAVITVLALRNDVMRYVIR